MHNLIQPELSVQDVAIADLKPADYNPRKWNASQTQGLRESITRFGLVDPLVVNRAAGRENVVIGGHFRLKVATDLGYESVPVVYVDIEDLDREKELNIRLNRNLGEFDYDLLKEFDQTFLADTGFTSEELDDIFALPAKAGEFDMDKELKKLGISEVDIEKGDIYELDGSRIMCGDSTIEADMLKLMGDDRADMVMTDPPYILDYTKGKKKGGKPTEGFGLKRDRKYLETDILPPDFTDLWMANVAKVQQEDFSIIVYENPKNLRTIWNALEKHWKYRNTIIWHIPNRVQGFAAKYKFFNRHDIALVGSSDRVTINLEPEDEMFENEYQSALYATSGKPNWESYEKGKKSCPTDFIEHIAGDKKSSGQEIIFGTKPIELLIPYIKVLTKRGDIVLEPFGGSGSTLIASNKIGRRAFLMEKVPTYMKVIINRWERETGKKAVKVI